MSVKIGLEIHCQLTTKTKLFCSCPTEPKKPNSNTCPICMGFPGSRPKVNEKAVEFGLRAALALHCKVNKRFLFSRKCYFYPDLPKNYQISQYEIPLAKDGFLMIDRKKIRIRRVHLEEDPAKIVHKQGYVLVDYNRSGVPLIEIVTEPDFTSAKEVRRFLEEISSIFQHLEIFDPRREAAMRVDINVSIESGNRVEIKNVTGFKEIEKVINFELIRQEHLKSIGMGVRRETRYWDPEKRETFSLRKKEFEEEYGYIFDPDLPWVEISDEWIKKIKEELPELPNLRVERFKAEYGLSHSIAQTIVYKDKALADFFEECAKAYKNYKKLANWIVGDLLKCLNWHRITIRDSKVTVSGFVEFLKLIDDRTMSERLAKEIIKTYVPTGEHPAEIVKKIGSAIRNEEILEKIVDGAIKENPQAIDDFKKGSRKALDFLIGKVLEKTKGRSDPKLVKEILKRRLGEPKG